MSFKATIKSAEEKLVTLDEKEASSSKEPSLKSSAIVDKVNVFYYASVGNKIFLGTVDEQTKFAYFSLIARDQLFPLGVRSSKTANKCNKREVTIGRVDCDAAQLVLEYINNNDISQPEPFNYVHLLENSTFALRCKVHHASNVFRIPRQLCGDVLRDRLCFEIRQLPTVTCADLQLICETAYFDAGLMNVMQNKVAYHTLRSWMAEHELACIREFVSKNDAVKGSNYVERINAIFEKLQADAAARGSVFQSGWYAEGVTPGQPSGAGQSVVMSTRPTNMAGGVTGKASLIFNHATSQAEGAHIHSAQANSLEDEEATFVRPSTAGPPLDLSSLPKTMPTLFTGKVHTAFMHNPKTVLKPGKADSSTADADEINRIATKTAPPNKSFGNVGGTVGAIKAAAGLNKSKGKLEVTIPKNKEQGEDKDGKNKGKGKENITPSETTPGAGSLSPCGKMSYAQMLSGGA